MNQQPASSQNVSLPGTAAFSPIRFRPIRFHARGGLGEVLVAEDVELVRNVAIKRIRSEQADNPDARARFLREAIVTARLDHPGVVPVYGCGAEPSTGRPYYAMRLIAGKPMSEAVAEFHRVTVRETGYSGLAFRQLVTRLVALCRTVGYAHSRGILHRDIKPSNVMLGEFGETLLVDWGLAYDLTGLLQSEIASAGVAETVEAPLPLTGPVGGNAFRVGDSSRRIPSGSSGRLPVRVSPDSRRGAGTPMLPVVNDSAGTATQQGAGSPGYMSPEQAAGEVQRLGPHSDIYSLGATLYHLLTGQAPLETESTLAAVSRTMTGDVPPPRSLRPRTPLALDAICRKAMALNPGHRYRSAESLAADLEAWLADQPVSCLPERTSARMGRWMREHPLVVGGGLAAVLVAAIAACVMAILVARQKSDLASSNQLLVTERAAADAARREAQRQEKEAKSAAAEALRLREDALHQRAEADRLRAVAEANLKTAQENFLLARRAVAECLDLAREHPIFQRPGNQDAKSLLLETARRYHERFRSNDRSSLTREEYVAAQVEAAEEARKLGRVYTARDAYALAIAELEKLVAEQPEQLRYRSNLAAVHNNLGLLLLDANELEAAESHYRQSLEIKRTLVKKRPEVPDARGDLARGLCNLASLILDRRGSQERHAAEQLLREALPIQEKLVAEFPSHRIYSSDLLRTLMTLGRFYYIIQDDNGSIAYLRQALEIARRQYESAPKNLQVRSDLGRVLSSLGVSYRAVGQREPAETHLLAALEIRLALVEENPAVVDYVADFSITAMALANFYSERDRPGDWEKAEKQYLGALKLQEELVAKRPGYSSVRSDMARTCWNLARLKSRMSERTTEPKLREALAVEAINWLRRVGPGWLAETQRDADFKPLRNRTDYLALMVEWEAARPPRGM